MKVADLFALFSIEVDNDKINKIEKSLQNLKSSAKKVALGFAAITTGAAVLIDRTASMAGRFSGLQEEIGVSSQAMQGWEFAAAGVGLELDNVVDFMGDLTEKAVEAREGNENFSKAFKDLGVNIKDANGNMKTTEELALAVADGFATITDKQKRTQLTMMLFSDEGRKLIPLLSKGSAGIEALKKEFVDLGGELSDETLAQLSNTSSEFGKVKAVANALKTQLVIGLLPAFTDIATQLVEWVKLNKEFLKENIAKAAETFGKVLLFVGRALAVVIKNIRFLTILLVTYKAAVVAVTIANMLLANSAGLAGTAMLKAWLKALAPIILMVAVVVAIALLIEDIWIAIKGGESVTGEFVAFLKDAFWEAVQAIKGFFVDMFEFVTSKIQWVVDRLKGLKDYFAGGTGETTTTQQVVRRSRARGSSDAFIASQLANAPHLSRKPETQAFVRRFGSMDANRKSRLVSSGFEPGVSSTSASVVNVTNNIQSTDPDKAARRVGEETARQVRANR